MTGRLPLLAGAVLAMTAPLATACANPAPSPAAPTIGADIVARDFYRWYVGLMAHDKEAGDDPRTYARYVATPLRARIQRQIDSPDGMDVDYFIKTQDYLDDWIAHVSATPARTQGATAQTIVTLGAGREATRLAVSLTREGGQWKIAAVKRA